jgi:hypothetical protein
VDGGGHVKGAPRLSLAAAAAREGKLAALPYDVLMLVAPTCVAALYTAAHEVAAADSAAAAAAEAEGEGGGGGGGGGGGRVRAAADVAEGVAALMGSLSEGLHASHARSLLLPVLQARLPSPHPTRSPQPQPVDLFRAQALPTASRYALYKCTGRRVSILHLWPCTSCTAMVRTAWSEPDHDMPP